MTNHKPNKELHIREIKPSEYFFLKEMLYQAIFINDENIILPKQIIEEPDLKRYIQNFGINGDFCLVAEQHGQLVGAIWIRYIEAYGFVDKNTPELSMAVLKEYRAKGIGSQLLITMIDKLKETGIKQVSLSVDKKNYAYNLYKRNGFIDYQVLEKSIIMTKKILSIL